MNIIKLLTVAFLSLILNTQIFAQKPNLEFREKEHNFGKFNEESGIAKYNFEFTNTGTSPLIISNVQASCGCTTPSWTKSPVMPSQKGNILVEYNPQNRPGIFSKTITIKSNTENGTDILTIKGEVIPKTKLLTELYRFDLGKVRFKSSHLAFTKIALNKTKTEVLSFINTSNEQIKITFSDVPKHITIKTVPETLAPNQEGEIVATYDASKQNKWGRTTDYVKVLLNGTYDNKSLTITAEIFEDFSLLSSTEKQNAARATFENREYNFGTIKRGEIVEHSFILKNTGSSILNIRKTSASCGCTASIPTKMSIQPGEQTEIKATFNSTGRSGEQYKTITVITNDPINTTTRLKIKGEVTVE